jgi:hypothetical protein
MKTFMAAFVGVILGATAGVAGELNVHRMEVGQRGHLPEGRIGQVITKGLYLMHFRDEESIVSIIVNYPKKELADGAVLKIAEEMVITGTHTYTTKGKDERTAFLVETAEVVDKSKEAKAKKEAEEAATKAAYEKAMMALTPFQKLSIGKWRITDGFNETRCFYILLVDHKASKTGKPDVLGNWDSTKDELRITWDDGHTDALRTIPDSKRLRVLSRSPGLD